MNIPIRRSLTVLLAGLVALGPLFTLAEPSDATHPLAGRVFASDLRTPMPDVLVQAIPEGAKEAVARATTDRRGRFRFRALPDGDYTLVLFDDHGSPLAAAPISASTAAAGEVALALPALRPGESGTAPAAAGATAVWLATPLGATVTLLASAIIIAVAADDVTGDNPTRRDLPPPSQSEP
ncbi:MAG: carboxypeptidase-like regulatory domain-containing protein [Acidobacteriota bacterium]|nr:carboxypeptidase-like regulatory domain-containing protein [Acidobacteriota bacterium]MDQ7088127.1 carboxypeptidase-like regulatory domain-containing protein [Acidobacteriota bacterium]